MRLIEEISGEEAVAPVKKIMKVRWNPFLVFNVGVVLVGAPERATHQALKIQKKKTNAICPLVLLASFCDADSSSHDVHSLHALDLSITRNIQRVVCLLHCFVMQPPIRSSLSLLNIVHHQPITLNFV